MRPKVLVVIFAAMLAMTPDLAGAQDEDGAENSNTRQCVNLISIKSTEVVDDQNILFHMNNGYIYRNKLPQKCHSLQYEKTLMYRSSFNRLCNVDIITVLRDFGFGFTPGVSCGLGMFELITEAEAEELRGEREEDTADS